MSNAKIGIPFYITYALLFFCYKNKKKLSLLRD